jgi:hypothetical protein
VIRQPGRPDRAGDRPSVQLDGPVDVVTTPIALTSWPYEITYEEGALIKALLLRRSC